jgi:hypothetical protein
MLPAWWLLEGERGDGYKVSPPNLEITVNRLWFVETLWRRSQ